MKKVGEKMEEKLKKFFEDKDYDIRKNRRCQMD